MRGTTSSEARSITTMSDMPTRQQLLESADRHEHELERALLDLKEAAQRPFEVVVGVKNHIAQHPLPWVIGSLLVGIWLGGAFQPSKRGGR
jgi:hypothetical protein